MTCYKPLQGYRSIYPNLSGKYSIVFNPKHGFVDLKKQVPCGQCIGCRLERSRQWAIRCVHEASLYENNCFITLTYDDNHLPSDGSLRKEDFQKFMKRLRKRFKGIKPIPKTIQKVPDVTFLHYPIRYYMCGEYGEKYKRPHYHALLFNFDFKDKYFWCEQNGEKLYRSAALEELWPFGHCLIGSVTFQSAAYVARYIMDKVTGDNASLHYAVICPYTGEILSERLPEYNSMSRRPGIAKLWFDRFKSDVYPKDEVIVRGKKVKPPTFYDRQYEILYPDEMEDIKAKRVRGAVKLAHHNTPERLEARRIYKEKQLEFLVRTLDKEL